MALRYWIGLNAADALVTAVAISLGAAEANPLLRLFALRLGMSGMLFVKALFAIALGGVIWQRGKVRMLTVMNYAMLVVLLFNMLMITYAL